MLYLIIEVAYGLPVAQSATSLWTVKSSSTFAVEGKVRLVMAGGLKKELIILGNTFICFLAEY